MTVDINWNGEGDGTKWSDINNWDNVVLPEKTVNTIINFTNLTVNLDDTLGAGQLLWTDTDAISFMDLWVTDGLVSTNDGFGQTVTSFAVLSVDGKKYGTGDTRLFIDLVDGDTKMWAETIPEPSTIGMMMVIGGGLFYIRRRRMI